MAQPLAGTAKDQFWAEGHAFLFVQVLPVRDHHDAVARGDAEQRHETDERADVAAELLASLDEPTDNPADVEAAWAAEIERRARRVLSGESAGEPWEDVRDRITRRLMK